MREGVDADEVSAELEHFTVTCEQLLPAPPGVVWRLLTDIEMMAGLGPEHDEAQWLDSERGPGARFRGRNRIGEKSWEVPCTVTTWAEPTAFGWVVGDPKNASSTWSYSLAPRAGGTWVTQTFRHGPGFSFLRREVEKDSAQARDLLRRRAATLEVNMSSVLSAASLLLRDRTTELYSHQPTAVRPG